MKYLKTFERFEEKNTNLYRIIVKDLSKRNTPPTYGIITSLKTRSSKSLSELKHEFENSEYYLKLTKNQLTDKFSVVVTPIFDPIKDTVNIEELREDVNGLRDYNDKHPISFKTQNIPPADRKDLDQMNKEVDFQQIQTEMQKILLPYLKSHEPNAEQNDAVQASDKFLNGNSIGPDKKKEIKNIVDSCKGNYSEAAKAIINRFKKEIVNNYYRKDNNPVEQGSSEMSRE